MDLPQNLWVSQDDQCSRKAASQAKNKLILRVTWRATGTRETTSQSRFPSLISTRGLAVKGLVGCSMQTGDLAETEVEASQHIGI